MCWATSVRPRCAASGPGWSAWCCRSWPTRSSRPSPRWSPGALAKRGFTPGAVHPHRRGGLRGRLRGHAARPARVRGDLRRRATTPRATPTTSTTTGWPSGACRRCWSTRAIEGIGFPTVSADDAVAVRQAYGHLRSLGPRADRPGARPGGPHAVGPQAGRVRRALAGSHGGRRADAVLDGGRPGRRRPGCCATASPASSAPPTCSRSARCGAPAGSGRACRARSRWSATTTRRSWPAPTRR